MKARLTGALSPLTPLSCAQSQSPRGHTMRLHNLRKAILMAALLGVAAGTSCGHKKGGDLTSNTPQQGNGSLPGMVGTVGFPGSSLQFTADDLPKATPIAGASGGAPLGTDPEYNVTPTGS